MKIKTEKLEKISYIASDGTVFRKENLCKEYEMYYNKTIMENLKPYLVFLYEDEDCFPWELYQNYCFMKQELPSSLMWYLGYRGINISFGGSYGEEGAIYLASGNGNWERIYEEHLLREFELIKDKIEAINELKKRL